MGKRQTPTRARSGAAVLAGLVASVALFSGVALAAPPTPEQTIAAIQAKAQAAIAWIDNRADQYYDYLATNPSPSAALAELNRAISDINAKAAETEVDITGKMGQHPNNQDVQQEGRDAIANVWDTAASEIDSMTVAYNAYIGGATTTTTTTLPPVTTTSLPVTTTTLPTVTTTLPTVTTTLPTVTTTTLPKVTTTTKPPTVTTTLPPVTTTTQPVSTVSTVSTSNTTTTVGGTTTTTVPTTTTTTASDLVAAAAPPAQPPQAPLSTAQLASKLGSMAAMTSAQPLTITSEAFVAEASTSRVSSVLELVRISLPAGVAQPIVDVLIIVQAVVAAFVSGAMALAWPAAVLLLVVAIQALRRWTPMLNRPDEPGAEAGTA